MSNIEEIVNDILWHQCNHKQLDAQILGLEEEKEILNVRLQNLLNKLQPYIPSDEKVYIASSSTVAIYRSNEEGIVVREVEKLD